ncbi:MAG TPA: Ig-like domain-containing protein, partial [Gemmatimonadales bacterium]|nr:Ig-like domain-containing protein [Gemmatimonadales bacterium]
MRKPTTLLLVLAMGLSCSKDSGTGPTFPASISVIPDSATVNLFDHVQLRAVVINNKGDTLNEAVSWSASPPTVAFVSPTGLTQGLSRGTATIHAALNGVEGLARVKVKITVIQVQLQPTGATLHVGDTLRIKDTLITANGQLPDDSIVTWTSSDTTKAVVSQSGLVTARAQGAVTISAQVDSAI